MKKVTLIAVSLCAVVVLVLSSFTQVVGYQTVTSPPNDSPLFQTRTERATKQQQQNITPTYLGKGKETSIVLPKREGKKEYYRQVITLLRGMDDKSFDAFVNSILSALHQKDDDQIKASDREIKEILYHLKHTPNALQNLYLMIQENGRLERTFQPECWLAFLFVFLLFLPYMLLIVVYLKILELFTISPEFIKTQIGSP